MLKMLKMLMVILISSQLQADFNVTEYENEMQRLNSRYDNNLQENKRLCKIFTKKAELYKATKRKDELKKATIKNCERRIKLYCNTL